MITETPQSVSRWAFHRRLYDWVLSLAHCKYATIALFGLSFAESSFFPIAPDVLQVALTLERRERAWYYAFVSTVASVLGGVFGYYIGALLWQLTAPFFLQYVFPEGTFENAEALYRQWDFWGVLIAAFTPIPYKVFTIAAGVFQVSLLAFILSSIIGRGGRFFCVAALLWFCGPSIKEFIDRYFNMLTLAFMAVLIAGIIAFQYL